MKKITITCLSLFITTMCFSQTNKIITNFSNGVVQVQQYASNIYKLTYSSNNYTTNENISDAVLLKPMAVINKLLVKNETSLISIGKKEAFKLIDANYKNNWATLRFTLAEDEKIFGGGERALPLNRRGYKFNLYNNPWYGYSEGADNLNYSVPFFTSNKGYGLFFDNPSKGYADIGKTNTNVLEVGFTSGELNVYVILGDDYKEILQSYHTLTGTQPLPPRWALGNLMSRFGYTSQTQVTNIVAKMKAENVPVNAVIFDLFWFGDSIKGTMGNLDWVNKKAWPNPKKMIGNFKNEGINTVLITEPFVLQSSTNYKESKQFHAVDSAGKPYLLTDFYFGKAGLIDIFRKDAQQWFWTKHKKQMKLGVEAWWGDLGEPEKHPNDLYHNLTNLGYKRLFKADEVHNLYGHTWTKMLYNSYTKDYPNKRLFSLNRSGFAGSQRYCIFPWTGDVSRSWSGLRAQLPIILGMSMSGVPYVHSDAGGFAGGEGDNELYIRWLQMAAFTPIFRPHGTALYDRDPNTFSFPSEAALIDTPYKKIAKQIIDLRYSMLPYNYTLAYEQATYGKPLIAPLYYHYPNDTAATHIQDEFMWGENILVAPVLQKAATTRNVYLPAGKWYTYTAPKPIDGNAWIDEKVGLQDCPIYIKEGAFLPVSGVSIIKATGKKQYSQEAKMINYFPCDNTTTYNLYMDDGISKNAIANKQYRLIHFKGVTKGKIVMIDIEEEPDNLYEKDKKQSFSLMLPTKLKTLGKATINGKQIAANDLMGIGCFINFLGKPLHIELEIE